VGHQILLTLKVVCLLISAENCLSQPGCRGSQGCREVVLRVSPNYGFSFNLKVFLSKLINNHHQGCLKVVAYPLGVPPNIFSQKECREPKKVEKHSSKVTHNYQLPTSTRLSIHSVVLRTLQQFFVFHFVNFINIFTSEFFVQTSFRQLFPRTCNVHVTRKSCQNNIRTKNAHI